MAGGYEIELESRLPESKERDSICSLRTYQQSTLTRDESYVSESVLDMDLELGELHGYGEDVAPTAARSRRRSRSQRAQHPSL